MWVGGASYRPGVAPYGAQRLGGSHDRRQARMDGPEVPAVKELAGAANIMIVPDLWQRPFIAQAPRPQRVALIDGKSPVGARPLPGVLKAEIFHFRERLPALGFEIAAGAGAQDRFLCRKSSMLHSPETRGFI